MKDSRGLMTARARAAWARLAEVEALGELRVVVREGSPLALPGCVGVLRLDGTVTVAVPHVRLVEPARQVVQSVAPPGESGESIALALAQDPHVAEVVAQASLFFGWRAPSRVPGGGLVRGVASDAEPLVAAVPREEADESSVLEVTSELSMVRDERGLLLAAAGYLRWPSDVAHLCVLAHPDHRGRGHAASAAADAVAHALHEGLLPQWRARPEPSKALARALGLTELGEQVSIRMHI